MTESFEVAIVGGGLAGACAAALLVRHAGIAPSRVLLLAKALPPVTAAAAPAARVVALSRASERVLAACGAWSRLDATRLCAYERMRVWHESQRPDADSALCFDAAEVGEPNLGYIAENDALLRACLESFRQSGGTLVDSPLRSLSVDADSVQLMCEDGQARQTRLAVGADGAASLVREQAQIQVRERDYQQLAIVATVASARDHAHTAWQCFLKTGPLALLPLFDGSLSIVWSLDRAEADSLLQSPVAEFEQRLTQASAEALGALKLSGQRLSFALRSVLAQSYVAPRCALIGDAAHVIHPLAGQGANLGLLDAAALCDAVAAAMAQREDPGALRILRGYEQQRRTHNRIMDTAMSALQGTFASVSGPGAWLLNRALAAVNRSALLKRTFARHALGTAGELPRWARAA